MKGDNVNARTVLAMLIAIFSISGVIAISVMTIYYAQAQDREKAAAMVFSSTLPLFGTWVGTLLAYYFAKDNFQAATDSAVALSQISLPSQINNLDSILVSAVISANFVFEDDLTQTIEQTKQKLTNKNIRRLLVLTQKRILQFLAYYEDIDAYNITNPNKTLRDFIEEFPGKNKPVVFVDKNITLAKANEVRKNSADCLDIIVTNTGGKDGTVIGYLTDYDIAKISNDITSGRQIGRMP